MPKLVADGLQDPSSAPSSSLLGDQPVGLQRQSPIVGPGPPPGLPPASQLHAPQHFRYDIELSCGTASLVRPCLLVYHDGYTVICVPHLYTMTVILYMCCILIYHDGYTFQS